VAAALLPQKLKLTGSFKLENVNRSISYKARRHQLRDDELHALRQLQAVSNTEATHTVRHYLYFAHEPIAKQVAKTLSDQGIRAEVRLGADNVNWLILVTVQIVPTESAVADTCAFFEQIAAENDGEYDGWEASVNSER
jgi:hypothetical protein